MHVLTTTVARVLFALPFGIFGILHLIAGGQMAPMVPIPGGAVWVYFTGLAMLAGCIGLITKIQGKWAALGLAVLMLLFILFVHLPGSMSSDQAQQQLHIAQVLKNLGLLGGALTWAGIFRREELSHPHKA